ncbi:MAG: hypothetical protein JO199_11700 [Candidatus Eremiobacteraeota bacterium]|nr:hypothetical protein [Candidatus Eremiobacteraeota bacterium]
MRIALALALTTSLGLLPPAAFAQSGSEQIALSTSTPLVGAGERIGLTIAGPGDPCSYELSVSYDSNGYLIPAKPLRKMLYVPHSEAGPAQTQSPCKATVSGNGSSIVIEPPSLMNAPGRYRLAVGKDGVVSNVVTIEIAP